MKTVGQILKAERKNQQKTINQIHKITKIPENTLKCLEEDNFSSLPPAPFIKGFIRSYALALNLDYQKLMAIFRRGWQADQKEEIIPAGLAKPLNKNTFTWNPTKTLVLGTVIIILMFLLYLSWQIIGFISKPNLKVFEPQNEQVFNGERIIIDGNVNQGSTVYINEKLIETDNMGDFTYELKLLPGDNIIEIKAINRRGKETIITRKVDVKY
jgi:hypothetical protein